MVHYLALDRKHNDRPTIPSRSQLFQTNSWSIFVSVLYSPTELIPDLRGIVAKGANTISFFFCSRRVDRKWTRNNVLGWGKNTSDFMQRWRATKNPNLIFSFRTLHNWWMSRVFETHQCHASVCVFFCLTAVCVHSCVCAVRSPLVLRIFSFFCAPMKHTYCVN